MKKIDLIGRAFGDLVVLSTFSSFGKFKCTWCHCKCICGKKKNIRAASLKRGDTKSCGCIKQRQRNHLWKGCGEMSHAYWTSVKGNAAQRGLDFSISIQEAWNVFLSQGRKCVFTNENLVFTSNYCHCKKKQTASLDRINSSMGYTLKNIRWIHKSINLMKMQLDDEEFIHLCKKVTEANLPILEAGKR